MSDKDEKEDEDLFLAVGFILRSNFNRFSKLTKCLSRDNIQGIDTYLTTIANIYELLQDYDMNGLISTSNRNNRNQGGGGDPGGGGNQTIIHRVLVFPNRGRQ